MEWGGGASHNPAVLSADFMAHIGRFDSHASAHARGCVGTFVGERVLGRQGGDGVGVSVSASLQLPKLFLLQRQVLGFNYSVLKAPPVFQVWCDAVIDFSPMLLALALLAHVNTPRACLIL